MEGKEIKREDNNNTGNSMKRNNMQGKLLLTLACGMAVGFIAGYMPAVPATAPMNIVCNFTVSSEGTAQAAQTGTAATTTQEFTQCIADSGAKFYGAYWCPHCSSNKALFGDYASMLPYIECDLGNNTFNPQCEAANITGFPTWTYQGQQYVGEQSLQQLAGITGCA